MAAEARYPNRKIAQPIDPTRSGGWRDRMSVPDQRTVEAICGPLMERLGYERRHGRIGAGAWAAALPGALAGAASIAAERLFPRLPFPAQVAFLDHYRRWDASLYGPDV